MELGKLRIDPVVDGEGRFKPMQSFRGTTAEDWAMHRDLLDADGLLPFVMGGFLVRGNGHTTLVDLGLGPKSLMGIQGGAFLDNLGAYGLTPADITDVLFTHLHEDHIGWGVQDGKITFPKATYRASSADVEHFFRGDGANKAERSVLDVIGSHIVAWDANTTTNIVPGIDQFAAPGHTPGSSVIVLSSDDHRAMLLGDTVHCPVQLVDEEWAGLFDVDPTLARETRRSLIREIEGSGSQVAAAHFPGLKFGRLLAGQGRRQWRVP